MADVRAFRAFRYDLGRVGNLSDVLAPSFGEIDPAMRQTLLQRSPYNVIRLLGHPPTPSGQISQVAHCLRDWQADEILVQDSARSLYVCHQDFVINGQPHTRRGVLARIRLDPFGSGRIQPLETLVPAEADDALALLRAVPMNVRPLLGLYPDPEGVVLQTLDQAVGRALPYQATDDDGVTTRLWPVHAHQEISNVIGMLGPKPIVLAAGHADYAAALRYLAERQALGEVHDDEAPAHFILMFLVGMSDPGLRLLPTRYQITDAPVVRAEQLAAVLGEHFEVEQVGTGDQALREIEELLEADTEQGMLGFGTADDVWQLARLKSPLIMESLLPERGSAYLQLASSVCLHLVEQRLPRGATGGPLRILLPPVTLSQVEQLASQRETLDCRLPFYPTLPAGLVFNSLRVH